ncbi:MAG: biotin/lipoyl-binding protein [Hyphomicrobiales bacterium]
MNFKPLLIIPPIALGILGFMWMTQPKDTVSTVQEEAKLSVRAMTVAQEPITLSAVGYGRVEAVQSWNVVSQVEGRALKVLTGLAVGSVVEAGDVLIQVDSTDYELEIAKAEANIAAAQATLLELTQQEENTKRLIEIEQRVLDVVQREFGRIQTLSKSGTASKASLDTAQKSLLSEQNTLIDLQNTLALYPAQRASAEATLAIQQAGLTEAQRGLANTTITAPFRGRISEEAIAKDQFVRVGDALLSLNAIDEAEVVGAFQPQAFGSLMRTAVGPQLQNVSQVDATRVIEYMELGKVKAFLELDFAGNIARYPAEPLRFRGSVDSETGTLGIAVRVKDPLVSNAQQGKPPLEFGKFVSVVLEAKPDTGFISIPRWILQQDDNGEPFVFTTNADNRLALTPVTVGPVVGDRILISSGLKEGDRVLLSTPRPSVPGLLLDVIIASETNQ